MKSATASARWAAGLALALLLPWAHAADSNACRADARKLCAGEKPGGGRVVACLQSHETELSTDCKAQLPMLTSCSAAVQRLCPDAKPRALRQCLSSHRDDIGPECAALAHR